MANKGKVWLVGAGPGDPGLLTLKGRDVLEQADVVIYDALVGQAILGFIPEKVKCINAGKHAGNHTIPQHEMNRIICEEALKGQRVVRLKGGDPYLFGRGGEEAEYLYENGVEFEIVPGITSPIAVSAYNGIPITHRDYASSVHFITAHKKKDEPLDLNFKALLEIGGTFVFMMGVAALSDICDGFLKAGMREDMPAAILSRGTTAKQDKIIATIATLPKEVEQRGIATPAIIVVGEVCSLADTLSWYEKFPLFGKKILVTRPRSRSAKMAIRLRELGAEVVELPSIRLEPSMDEASLKAAIEQINRFKWIVFTSPAGVEIFFEQLMNQGCDVRKLANAKFAVIGGGTAKELRKFGVVADLVPEVYENEALAAALCQQLTERDRVLIPRASIGNPILTEMLEQAGADITDLSIYDTKVAEYDWLDLKEMIEEKTFDFVTFTSASTVHSFVQMAGETCDFTKVFGVCIGRQTREAAESYNMKTITAEKATIESMCDMICSFVTKEQENGFTE